MHGRSAVSEGLSLSLSPPPPSLGLRYTPYTQYMIYYDRWSLPRYLIWQALLRCITLLSLLYIRYMIFVYIHTHTHHHHLITTSIHTIHDHTIPCRRPRGSDDDDVILCYMFDFFFTILLFGIGGRGGMTMMMGWWRVVSHFFLHHIFFNHILPLYRWPISAFYRKYIDVEDS